MNHGPVEQKPRLLFLTQRIPYPPIKGEKIRPLQILRWLAERYEVYLGCLIDDPDDWQHTEIVAELCADAHFAGLNRRAAYARSLTALVKGTPQSFEFYRNAGLQRWIDAVLSKQRPDVIFVCSSNMTTYVTGRTDGSATVVIDYADVDAEKWRAYAERSRFPMSWVYAREARSTLRKEREAARSAAACTFVTEPEAALFRDLAPEAAGKTFAVVSGVDTDYFNPEEADPAPYPSDVPNFVLTGTMSYPPNIDAARWFCDEILPAVRARHPRAAFQIVGAQPTAAVIALGERDGVHVTGRVADVRPYLAGATAAVVPLRVARGIQNKVLEGMAMAKPVVATAEALEGIDARPGREIVLAKTAESFAAALISLADGTYPGQQEMGGLARQRMLQDYSWHARLAAFAPLLNETAGSK